LGYKVMTALSHISKYMPTKQGFCRPDWKAISAYIKHHLPESERKAAWERASSKWVDHLCRQLRGKYRVWETPHFLILTEASERIGRDVCKSCEAALKHILTSLPGIASDEGFGKYVVLMIASLKDYYRYISYFYSEGEHPMSGGVCLDRDGYTHFVFPTTEYFLYSTTLVHELTHACLAHRPIPAWLNEAIAVRMEETLCGPRTVVLDRELYDRHVAYWNANTIQTFWSGESWQIPGDSFELSYNLAQVLWRKIEIDIGASREDIMKFIATANARDGGEAAFQSIFKMSLADLIISFLGKCKWKPAPKRWPMRQLRRRGISSVALLQR
jgi:hypothetical protein